MNLPAAKLELVKMILYTNDKNIIREVKTLFKNQFKVTKKTTDLDEFYEGFTNGIKEIKSARDAKEKLKNAQSWLNELQD